LRDNGIIGDAERDRYRVLQIRDDAIAPASDLVAKDPEPVCWVALVPQ